MTYLTLGASLALAAFLAVDVAASLVVALIWRAARGGLDRVSAAARAESLFLLRVFPPAAAAIIVLGVWMPAFWRFEPRQTTEAVGESLVALAVMSGAVIVAGVWRGWQASRATRRVLREWLHHGRPLAPAGTGVRVFAIPARFPVVSLVGVLRPRLFVSERVLDACGSDELSAMMRHECGHLTSADNLKRLALRVSPDLLLLTSLGRDLERGWHEASEEAADDYAARMAPRSALALATGLLRVARMAPSRCASIASMTALYQGDGIERRVRRLVGGDPQGAPRAAWLVAVRALAAVPAAFTVAALLDGRLLQGVHQLIEIVVETLP